MKTFKEFREEQDDPNEVNTFKVVDRESKRHIGNFNSNQKNYKASLAKFCEQKKVSASSVVAYNISH
jgi:hypothetical protein